MIKKAFTTLELVLVLSIFMMMIGLSFPKMVGYMFVNDVEVASQEVVHVLRNAHSNATMQIHDSAWGVNFDSANAKYTFYAAASPDHDIVYLMPVSISLSSISLNGGVSDLQFDQITGSTDEYGSLVLTAATGETRTITINALGNVRSD